MSKYIGWIDGEAHEYRYVKREHDEGQTVFYLGETLIATLYRMNWGMSRVDWSVVVHGDVVDKATRTAKGFRTRHDAIGYALQIHEKTRYGDS